MSGWSRYESPFKGVMFSFLHLPITSNQSPIFLPRGTSQCLTRIPAMEQFLWPFFQRCSVKVIGAHPTIFHMKGCRLPNKNPLFMVSAQFVPKSKKSWRNQFNSPKALFLVARGIGSRVPLRFPWKKTSTASPTTTTNLHRWSLFQTSFKLHQKKTWRKTCSRYAPQQRAFNCQTPRRKWRLLLWIHPRCSWALSRNTARDCVGLRGLWMEGYIWSYETTATSTRSKKNAEGSEYLREILLFQGNPGWWNIIIWPDIYIYMYIMLAYERYWKVTIKRKQKEKVILQNKKRHGLYLWTKQLMWSRLDETVNKPCKYSYIYTFIHFIHIDINMKFLWISLLT